MMTVLRSHRLTHVRLLSGRTLTEAESIFARELMLGVKPSVAYAAAFLADAAKLAPPKLRGRATKLARDPDIVLRLQELVRHSIAAARNKANKI